LFLCSLLLLLIIACVQLSLLLLLLLPVRGVPPCLEFFLHSLFIARDLFRFWRMGLLVFFFLFAHNNYEIT
jgi:hypothetical protein